MFDLDKNSTVVSPNSFRQSEDSAQIEKKLAQYNLNFGSMSTSNLRPQSPILSRKVITKKIVTKNIKTKKVKL